MLENGNVISNETLTKNPNKTKSYAFCSDTSYKPDIVPIIKNVTLLYHEATFLNDREDLAKKTRHSTAKQAATIALNAEVTQLIIGHYSSRYKDVTAFKDEAETVFPNVILAAAGKEIKI